MSEKENNLVDKFVYLNEYAKLKYDNELRREDSIIQQASQMQTAFSFVIAALYMAAPIILQYRGTLSLEFFLLVFASITIALIFSLLFATLAQNRKRTKNFVDISEFIKYMEENENLFDTEEQRLSYISQTYGKVQQSKATLNDKRITKIRISMYAFYIALGLCAFWFVVALCKII